MACTSFPQGRGGGPRRRAARVDVVDEADAWRRGPSRRERARDVPTTLLEAETALPLDPPRPAQQQLHRHLPTPPELTRQCLRRRVPSPEAAILVAGNEREHGDLGPRERLDDELCRLTGQPALATLLPSGDEAPGTLVVENRRPSGGEGDPAPGALGTPPHRPGAGRAAAGAERRGEPDQPAPAGVAQRRAGVAAACAPLRENELEHDLRLGPKPQRDCIAFVSVL